MKEAATQAKAEPRPCLSLAQGLGFWFVKPWAVKAKPKPRYPGRAQALTSLAVFHDIDWMLSEMWGLKAARGKWSKDDTVTAHVVLAVCHVTCENESGIIKIQEEYKRQLKNVKIIVSMCRTWACSSVGHSCKNLHVGTRIVVAASRMWVRVDLAFKFRSLSWEAWIRFSDGWWPWLLIAVSAVRRRVWSLNLSQSFVASSWSGLARVWESLPVSKRLGEAVDIVKIWIFK